MHAVLILLISLMIPFSVFAIRLLQVTAALDEVNDRYGNFTLTYGSVLDWITRRKDRA